MGVYISRLIRDLLWRQLQVFLVDVNVTAILKFDCIDYAWRKFFDQIAGSVIQYPHHPSPLTSPFRGRCLNLNYDNVIVSKQVRTQALLLSQQSLSVQLAVLRNFSVSK